MTPTQSGSFRLFRLAGINVFLHWSWLLVAMYQIQNRRTEYSSLTWNVVEYLALFLIVLMHEFGHSLACRQVGGTANQIVLWPLGGVAYVSPPPRPGALLWSIAAGPLVNVGLFILLTVATWVGHRSGWSDAFPNADTFLRNIWWINTGLLVFNLFPVYPLDGGQILQALLWFKLGPIRSLLVATSIGFVGVAILGGLAIWMKEVWLGIITVFIFMNCKRGFTHARAMAAAQRNMDSGSGSQGLFGREEDGR